jgi:hypothetical protein
MRKIKSIVLGGLVTAALLFGAMGGCSEEHLSKMDKAVADANHAAQIPRAVADSPALSPLIPPEIRIILELLGFAGTAAFGIWQKIRASGILAKSQDKSLTLKAIADAIDALDPKQAQPVKAEIKQVMQDREILSTANAIVDEHRSKLAA